MTLDNIDLILLNELQKDGKQSIKKLAEKVNLSITPVHERIKKMETTGIITKYVAIVDAAALGRQLIAYCQVKLTSHQEHLFGQFEEYIKELDEVLEASYMAGNYDFLLKVVLNDMQDYQNFVVNKIAKLNIISNISSAFVLKPIKATSMIKMEEEEIF